MSARKAKKLAMKNQIVAGASRIFRERSLKANDQNRQTGKLKIALIGTSNLIPTTNALKMC
jgi:hypothetical protein